MISHQAEKNFREGKELLELGRAREALAPLRSAIAVEEEAHGECRQARYLSYYGLCLCVSRTDLRASLRLCREAVRKDASHPDLWWNSGRVALALGRRGEAYRAWQRGLGLDPDHRGIRGDLARMGLRRLPVLSFLPRRHPVNVFLGRLRSSLVRTGSRGSGSGRAGRVAASPGRARVQI